MDPLEGDGSLHRMFLEGGAELYMTGFELETVKKLVMFCDECAAYHLRPEFTEHEFITALNEPFLEREKGDSV